MTIQTISKDCYRDPLYLYKIRQCLRIKGTLGITGLYFLKVHIDGNVWHLDVDLSHPGGAEAPKGFPVRELKWLMSWV